MFALCTPSNFLPILKIFLNYFICQIRNSTSAANLGRSPRARELGNWLFGIKRGKEVERHRLERRKMWVSLMEIIQPSGKVEKHNV